MVIRARKVILAQRDSLGRNALIAIVTGTLVAGLVVLAPRVVGLAQAPATESVARPSSAARLIAMVEHAAMPTPESEPAVEDPGAVAADRAEEVPVALVVSLTPPGPVVDDASAFDGEWTINVTASTEEPWAIDVFVEGVGQVPCDTEQLVSGEGATCTIAAPLAGPDAPTGSPSDTAPTLDLATDTVVSTDNQFP